MWGDYDSELALERSRKRAVSDAADDTTSLGTIPFTDIEVNVGALESLGGTVAGSLVAPVAVPRPSRIGGHWRGLWRCSRVR